MIDYQDEGIDVFFVVAGAVRVLIYAKSGREVILADLEAGGFFGEMAPIDGHPRSASVLAVSEAVVATMPGPVFLEVLNAHPEVSMFVLKLLAARVRELDNRVLEFSTLDVWHRVSCELLRLARPDPNDPHRGVLSPAPTQAEIAARVSTSREAVVREMKALEREGFLHAPAGRAGADRYARPGAAARQGRLKADVRGPRRSVREVAFAGLGRPVHPVVPPEAAFGAAADRQAEGRRRTPQWSAA